MKPIPAHRPSRGFGPGSLFGKKQKPCLDCAVRELVPLLEAGWSIHIMKVEDTWHVVLWPDAKTVVTASGKPLPATILRAVKKAKESK